MADLTDSLIAHVELQLKWQGAMHALIEWCIYHYKIDQKAARCTIMTVVQELSKTRKGRMLLKGEKALPTLIKEIDKLYKAGKLVFDCDLTQYLESKGTGDDSMVRAK